MEPGTGCGSQVFEEEVDEDYEPTSQEVEEYAKWLGLDLQTDSDLLWIAREGLKAPLPQEYKPCRSADGDLYYYNFVTGVSTWTHPCDQYYKSLFQEEKRRAAQRARPATASQQPLFGGPAKQEAQTLLGGGLLLRQPTPASQGVVGTTRPSTALRLPAPSLLSLSPQQPWLSPCSAAGAAAGSTSDSAGASGGKDTGGGSVPTAARLHSEPSTPRAGAMGSYAAGATSAGASLHASAVPEHMPASGPGLKRTASPKRVHWQDMSDPLPAASVLTRPAHAAVAMTAAAPAAPAAAVWGREWAGSSAQSPTSPGGGSDNNRAGSSYAQQMQVYRARMAAEASAAAEAGARAVEAAGEGVQRPSQAEGDESSACAAGDGEACTAAMEAAGERVQGPAHAEGEEGSACAAADACVSSGPPSAEGGSYQWHGNGGSQQMDDDATNGGMGRDAHAAGPAEVGMPQGDQYKSSRDKGAASEWCAAARLEQACKVLESMGSTDNTGGAGCKTGVVVQGSGSRGSSTAGEMDGLPGSRAVPGGGQECTAHSPERCRASHQATGVHGSFSNAEGSSLVPPLPALQQAAGPSISAMLPLAATGVQGQPEQHSKGVSPRSSMGFGGVYTAEDAGSVLDQVGTETRCFTAVHSQVQQEQQGRQPPASTTASLTAFPQLQHSSGAAMQQQGTGLQAVPASSSHTLLPSTGFLQPGGQQAREVQAVLERLFMAAAAETSSKAQAQQLRDQALQQRDAAARSKHQMQLRLEDRHLASMEQSLRSMKENMAEISRVEAQSRQLFEGAALQCQNSLGRRQPGSRTVDRDSFDAEMQACLEKLQRCLMSFAAA